MRKYGSRSFVRRIFNRTWPKKWQDRRRELIFLLLLVISVSVFFFQQIRPKLSVTERIKSSVDIVEIAKGELGNSGGKYCSWWGYTRRQEWCAVFVCWCAEKAGYRADEDYIFTVGTNGDIDYPDDTGAGTGCHARFHNKLNRYHSRASDYIPQRGDLIYFDWDVDNEREGVLVMDHIGIVEKVQWGKVYTIEGNRQEENDSKDLVRSENYLLSDPRIRGYSCF